MCGNNMLRGRFILTLFTLFLSFELSAGNGSTMVRLYFNQGSNVIIDSYNLQKLTLLVENSRDEIRHINIVGYSSPEGDEAFNMRLSKLRSESVRDYLTRVVGLPDSLITTSYRGVAWERFVDITQNQELPFANDVKAIIESENSQERNVSLMKLNGGETYKYLLNNIYPQLRFASVTVAITVLDDEVESSDPPLESPIIPVEDILVVPIAEGENTDQNITQIQENFQALFAVKTNLLFDIATLINVEIEVPIKDRWSIAAEYIFPWWIFDNHKADSRRNRIQLLSGNLEGRYWWGERSTRPILTGWFTGLYAGVGSYDFEYQAKGYQGEFFIAAGLSGGYAHTINRAKNLRLEYSLGIGCLATDYRHYHAEFCINERWHAIEQSSGRYSWFGPTRARVSLSWLINCNEKNRR